MCVSSSMSIHRPGELVIGHFITIVTTHVIITSVSASECVALFSYVNFGCVSVHVCKHAVIDLLTPDLSNVPF